MFNEILMRKMMLSRVELAVAWVFTYTQPRRSIIRQNAHNHLFNVVCSGFRDLLSLEWTTAGEKHSS